MILISLGIFYSLFPPQQCGIPRCDRVWLNSLLPTSPIWEKFTEPRATLLGVGSGREKITSIQKTGMFYQIICMQNARPVVAGKFKDFPLTLSNGIVRHISWMSLAALINTKRNDKRLLNGWKRFLREPDGYKGLGNHAFNPQSSFEVSLLGAE